MSAWVTYVGDPVTGDGPEATTLWGHSLVKGEPTQIDDPKAIEMAHRNPHFKVSDDEAVEGPPVETGPEPVETVVPEDWETLHHFKRISLAKSLAPDIAPLIKTADDADEVIRDHVNGNGN